MSVGLIPVGLRSVGLGPEVAAGGATTYTYNGSGTVTLSGAATLARWRSYAGAGTVTLSGTASLTRWRAWAGSGTVTLSGAATTAYVEVGTVTYAYNGAGTVALSGAAAVARLHAYAGSGTVALSGAAVTDYTPGLIVYTYAGSGTIVLSGAATTTGPVIASRASGAGKAKHKRRRTRIIREEHLTAEERRRLDIPEPEEAQREPARAERQPKRAKRVGKTQRGIQLSPVVADAEAQRASEILAQRTAELMAQQREAQEAMRAEGMAMLQSAAAIEAENEMLLLLLMAA